MISLIAGKMVHPVTERQSGSQLATRDHTPQLTCRHHARLRVVLIESSQRRVHCRQEGTRTQHRGVLGCRDLQLLLCCVVDEGDHGTRAVDVHGIRELDLVCLLRQC